MKVTAKMSNGNWLLECSEQEAARLAGYFSNSTPNDYHRPVLVSGSVFEISPMYEHLYKLRKASYELDQARNAILSFADLLQLPVPIVEVVESLKEELGGKS